jgi:hypothetical protein
VTLEQKFFEKKEAKSDIKKIENYFLFLCFGKKFQKKVRKKNVFFFRFFFALFLRFSRRDEMGGGSHPPHPKWVWSPSGGWQWQDVWSPVRLLLSSEDYANPRRIAACAQQGTSSCGCCESRTSLDIACSCSSVPHFFTSFVLP